MELDQGAVMSNSVERERPIDWHGPAGEMTRIVLLWGNDDDPVPVGLLITVMLPDGQMQTLHEKTTYKDYQDARERGIKMAKDTMSRMSGHPQLPTCLTSEQLVRLG
jgi:hypothetical protein